MDTALTKRCPECKKLYIEKETRLLEQVFRHDIPDCDCEARKDKEIKRAADLDRLVQIANIPAKYLGEDMKDWVKVPGTERMTDMVKDYLKNLDHNLEVGRGMLWVGPNGTGKTWLISWLMRKIMERTLKRCYFIDADQLSIRLASMRDGSREMSEFADLLTNVAVLNLDDFGGSDIALWKQKYVSHTMYQRYYNGRVVFFSTNCHFKDLETIHGKAVMSRIIEMCGPYILEIESKVDMRIEANRENYGNLRVRNHQV